MQKPEKKRENIPPNLRVSKGGKKVGERHLRLFCGVFQVESGSKKERKI
jgi:hypothetical protein